ncbi:holin [Leuconostoc mesenteroides]
MTATVIIIVLTWLIVQAIKSANLPGKYLPLIALFVGIVLSVGISLYTGDANLLQDILVGAGAGATGLNETASKSISGIINNIGDSITKTK